MVIKRKKNFRKATRIEEDKIILHYVISNVPFTCLSLFKSLIFTFEEENTIKSTIIANYLNLRYEM